MCRSSLAVPGSDPHKMEKSMDAGADEVFFDLEDAVAADRKAEARRLVIEAITRLGPFPHVQAVRINEVGSGMAWRDIVEIVERAGDKVDRLIVPKVRSAADVIYVERLLDELEGTQSEDSRIKLEILVETASGAANLLNILSASRRVVAVILGLGDYTAELGVERPLSFGVDTELTAWVASKVVNHAIAAGVAAIDGPFPALRDEPGYRAAAAKARRFGFMGKWCIHPAQVPWCNEAFLPRADEIAEARRIMVAYEEAVNAGRGAVALDGCLVDEATRKHAARILAASTTRGEMDRKTT